MAHLYFFDRNQSYNDTSFQSKLSNAMSLIKANHSLVASKVYEVINANILSIRTFSELSKDHYLRISNDFKEDYDINLPNRYPPTPSAVKQIESKLEGIIFDNKYIYISSNKSAEQIASTLVHEICHFLNKGLYAKEQKVNDSKQVSYSDEVRAFTAEKMFERNGTCLLRSDMKEIHHRVTNLYPEFTGPEKDTLRLGYLFSSYDTPMS